MGGMGRACDGSYAEYPCVPTAHLQRIDTTLSWETLGAVPEMLQTVWGSLFKSLRLQRGERLLIRGGTTSVGLAAASLSKNHGYAVASKTRNADRSDLLRAAGAGEVFIDAGSLIGTTTLKNSLRCPREGGVVCMTGRVGNQWSFDNFEPMEVIPTAVSLTTYSGTVENFMQMPLADLIKEIAAGTLQVHVGKRFTWMKS